MESMQTDDVPAVLITQEDGRVINQNVRSQRLMGEVRGQSCWDVVGGLPTAKGLPCATGCVGKLLRAGLDRSRHSQFKLDGVRHQLSCTPVNGVVVCALGRGVGEHPGSGERLTPQEQKMLQCLAEGRATFSAAEKLGIRESTLRSHVEKMRIKLGVKTRAGLVALGFRLGYLD